MDLEVFSTLDASGALGARTPAFLDGTLRVVMGTADPWAGETVQTSRTLSGSLPFLRFSG